MKKLLLFGAAIFAALVVCTEVAAKNLPKSRVALKANKQVQLGAFKSVEALASTRQAFWSDAKISNKKFLAPMKEEENMLKMNYTYAMYTYVYSELLKGTLLRGMYDAALFGFNGDNLYFTPFGSESTIIAGKADPTIKDELTEDGGVAYVLDLSTVKIEDEGTNYVMRTWEYGEDNSLIRLNDTKITVYYFADYEELYIPDYLGIWPETVGEKDAPIVAVEDLDLMPASAFEEAIYKGTFKGKTYGDKELSGDVVAFASQSMIAVKGFAPLNEDEWVIFVPDLEEETASVPAYQMLSEGSYWADEEHTSSFTECDVTLGINVSNEGGIVYPNEDYSSTYFLEFNEDESFLLENDKKAFFAVYAFADNEDYEGFWGNGILTSLTINVSNELVTNGVKGIATTGQTATEYYDLQGRKVNASKKGMVIKKTTQADGTVKTMKLMNK